jgi:hypothetical protein
MHKTCRNPDEAHTLALLLVSTFSTGNGTKGVSCRDSVGNRHACMTVGFAHADESSYVVIRGNSV